MSLIENVAPADLAGEVEQANLFSPLTLRGITLRNRIAVSPMCMYSSEDGFANEWHNVHLGSRAVGGAALIITEANAVEARGRISPQDLGIWKDEHIEGLRRLTDFIKSQGAVPGTQLAHAGRKASTHRPFDYASSPTVPPEEGGWQVVGPTDVPFNEVYPKPQALSVEEIQEIVVAWKEAARRSREAGFQVIEIHAAHGYLLHQFYSPVSNTRTDQYGGSFENRIRLLLEVVEAVRSEWPEEYPLFVRISATDWLTGIAEESWRLADSVRLAKELRTRGVDVIDVSSGGNSPTQQVQVSPGYQVPFAQAVRTESDIMTAAVGLITEPEQADTIIRKGQADIVAIGRELLRDPYWPQKAARALGQKVRWPDQYARA